MALFNGISFEGKIILSRIALICITALLIVLASRRYRQTIGVLLLFVNSLFGIKGAESSWPFACYPKFAGIEGPRTEAIKIVALSSTGKTIPLDEQVLKQKFSTTRFTALMGQILKTEKYPEQLRIRLQSLWLLLVQNDLNLQQADSVRVYKDTLLIIPERRRENPLHRELLYELKL